jgi:hypothetical protein
VAALAFAVVFSIYGRDIERPTMGWSSWNTYYIDINDSLIMSQADAMVRLGLKDAGFLYINIDDGYFGGRDKATGRLLIHPTRFPRGLKPVVDYIHGLGLKSGIYSDAGANTCGNFWNDDTIAKNVGLLGHEQQDIDFFFKELGCDFIKVDFCGADGFSNHAHYSFEPYDRYKAIHEAIERTGRKDVKLNVCRWNYPGTWVSDVATSWRISEDIRDNWASVRNIIGQSLYLSAYAGNGRYNDMDMLEVGRSMTEEEDRTHFGIWCIMASPLLIGCDMTTLKPETHALLTNRELIALNQDALGLQAYVASTDGKTYVLVKDIEEAYGNVRAIALYNPTDEPQEITVDMTTLDLGGKVRMRDLFACKDAAEVNGKWSETVAPHGVRIYRLEAEKRLERSIYEGETAYLSSYQEIYNPMAFGTGTYFADSTCSGGMKAGNLGMRPQNDLRWRNVYSKNGGSYDMTIDCLTPEKRKMIVVVNGGEGTVVEIEPSSEGITSINIKVDLKQGENEIRLYNDRARMPEIDRMILKPMV